MTTYTQEQRDALIKRLQWHGNNVSNGEIYLEAADMLAAPSTSPTDILVEEWSKKAVSSARMVLEIGKECDTLRAELAALKAAPSTSALTDNEKVEIAKTFDLHRLNARGRDDVLKFADAIEAKIKGGA